ncbi:hypothetical protein [Brevibacillus laterosporus]
MYFQGATLARCASCLTVMLYI